MAPVLAGEMLPHSVAALAGTLPPLQADSRTTARRCDARLAKSRVAKKARRRRVDAGLGVSLGRFPFVLLFTPKFGSFDSQ